MKTSIKILSVLALVAATSSASAVTPMGAVGAKAAPAPITCPAGSKPIHDEGFGNIIGCTAPTMRTSR